MQKIIINAHAFTVPENSVGLIATYYNTSDKEQDWYSRSE